MYSLGGIAVLILAFYTWRLTVWKSDAGGWWNLAMGKKPVQAATGSGSGSSSSGSKGNSGLSVDAKISELASALGIPPATLATAIASAVSDHVPPASLSSIAKTESTASVVQSMVADPNTKAKEEANSFGNKMAGVVGMDEPGIGLD